MGGKSNKQKTEFEKYLYDPVRKLMANVLPHFDIPPEEYKKIEITNYGFSNKFKSRLNDVTLLSLKTEGTYPDLAGFLKDAEGFDKFVVIEVKKGKIKLKDIYQTKTYAEVLQADYAFLVYTEELRAEIERVLKYRPPILSYAAGYNTIILIQTNKDGAELEHLWRHGSDYTAIVQKLAK